MTQHLPLTSHLSPLTSHLSPLTSHAPMPHPTETPLPPPYAFADPSRLASPVPDRREFGGNCRSTSPDRVPPTSPRCAEPVAPSDDGRSGKLRGRGGSRKSFRCRVSRCSRSEKLHRLQTTK